MINESIRILIVEDLAADAELAKREILKMIKDCEFRCVETREAYIEALAVFQPDLILSDYHLPHFDGMKALKLASENSPLTPFIIWTGSLSEDIAVDCMRTGANNYIIKENIKRLAPAVVHALEERRLLLDRKQADEALENSEKRFRALIENGLDNISLLAADGSLIWESPAVFRTLDYASDEFVGQDIFKLMHPEDLDWTRKLFAQLLREPGSRQRGEFRLRHSSGAWRWVEAVVTNMLDEPSVNAIVVNYRDITERKQAEEASRESEHKAEALLNALPDLMFRLDREGTFLDYKAERSDLYAQSDQTLIGKKNRDIAPPEFADLIERYTRQTLNSGQMQIFEYQLPIPERGLRYYEARMVTSGKDEVTAIVRDITERKQAEKALLESETRYRALFEDTPIAVWEEDFSQVKRYLDSLKQQGVTDFHTYFATHPETVLEYGGMIKILDVNKAAVHMYQAESKEQLIESTDQELSQGELEHIHEVFIDIAEGLNGGTWEGADETLMGKSIEISLSWSIAPGHEDDFSKVIVTTLDITERKQAEMERQTLLEIMQGHANTNDLQEFLKHIHHSIARVTYAENFFTVLYNESSSLFEEIYSVDQYDPPQPPSGLEKSITSYVFRTGEPLLLTQAGFDELVAQGEVELVGTDSASWLGVPLKTPTETIGVIAVQDYENPNRYSERDKDFLASIAAQVALTIERKRAEESLRQEQEKAQNYLDIAGVMLLALDRAGKVTLINQKGCELLGYSFDEIIGKDWIETFLPSEARNEMKEVFQQLMAGDAQLLGYYENPILTKNGEERIIAWHNTLVRDGHGTIISSLSSGEDITERKQAEEQLRKLSRAVEQSASTIVITDAAGNIEYVNPQFTETTGYTFHEAVGQNPRILKSGHTSPEEYKRLWEKITSGEQWQGELHNKKKNGDLFWEYVTISPIFNERGETTHFIAVKEEITQRKQAEAETRRHLAELEALYENGLAVGRLLKPGEIGNRIIETFARYLSWHHVAIRLKRPESDDLELIALNQPGLNEQERAEMERHFNSMISKVDQGLSGWVIQTGEQIRTGNVHTHPQYVGTQEGIQSGLYMPLRIGGRIIGSISVESEAADAFTAQDERLLATLANQAAIAFENARLYQSAQRELAERKRLQEQLDQEHAQLKALFASIPDPVWLKDPEGTYLACNPVLEELIDIPEAQILGKTDYDLLDKNLAEHFKAKDQEAINRNLPMTYQEWVTYPNKQPRLMETVRTPMHADTGSLIGVLGISHDITAMHNTQQELRESQELYRLLVETSPDGIGILGLDGTIIFANEQLADLFGMQGPSDCIGTNFNSLVAPEEHPRITEHFDDTMPNEIFLEEYWMTRKDGSRFYGEARSSLSLDKAGQPRWIIGQIRDITESKTSQETIQEERQRFLDLFENTPVAIWLEDFSAVLAWMEQLRIRGVTDLKEYLTKNPDQLKYGLGLIRILSVNQTAVEMNGAHDKAHLLEKFHQLVLDAAPPGVMVDELDMLWKGKTSFEFEMTSRRLDGTLTTGILHVYTPINNGRPDYGRVILASTDISERVNTEKALQASETHYRELADSITDVFFEMDSKLHYIYWNKSSETLTGITAKDAIGKSLRQIFGETEEQVRIEKIYQDVLSNHRPRAFESSLMLENHQYIFEINAYPSTRGVSVVAKDVTDRKKSEIIMQKRFELMEYSAQHSLSEVMQKTIDEVSQLTGSTIGFLHFVEGDQITLGLQTWSTSALQLFNVPVREGAHLPLDRAGVWADAVRERRPMIHNDYASLPNRKGLPEGHAPITREMVIPIIRSEKTVAVLGIGNRPEEYTQRDLEIAERFADYAWDITERKQMEIALADERNQLAKRVEERAADLIRANTNLARALRVKDEFLANMSHELRTPLNAILGLSESLGEQIAGPLNEKQQKYITTISESGRHLLSLINDILDLAKIEAGQITLDINRVDVKSVSEASLRMIKQLSQNKHQDVTLEIDEGIGLIWADERRLKQMIVNLLSNAVKFTPENGKIGLEVHGNRNENEVMITVWDNGIGMKEKDLSRLFQPFVQLDSGLARETTGTGLGLALVAQMVRLHGGSVRVASHPEQGSHFTIVLPWEPALAIDTTSKMKITGKFRAVTLDSNNRPTILLIEDTNEVIMMIRDYLELAGYHVITAKDGVEGITQAQLMHPDLILMDVMMPRMDGLEATRRLRSEPEFAETPIIALTALAMPSDRERCISAGMNDYMSKPVNLKELVKTIQSYLVNTEETGS